MTPSHGGLNPRLIGCAVVAMVAIGLGFVMPEFATLQATNWVLYGLLAISLTLVWGHGGIFSFGQGAFFGIGAYAYSIAAINFLPTTNETISSVLVAAIAAAALAALVGYFIFYGNVGDVYVGIITLAMTLVLFTVLSSTADPKYHLGDAQLGGYNGISGVPPITLPGGESGTPLSVVQSYSLVVLLSALIVAGLYILLHRPFGRVLTALRENELRTQLLAFDVRLRKLVVFSIGGGIAGIAGAFYAAWAMFISPVVFGLALAAQVVIWVLVGGRVSFLGAFVGTLLIQSLSFTLGGGAGDATPIVLGVVLIAIVLFLPSGIVPSITRLALSKRRSTAGEAPVASTSATREQRQTELPFRSASSGAALTATGLEKRFGGVRAVRKASVKFSQKGVHCLIGPNGAGKSTFFNLLVGRFPPNKGAIELDGRLITRMKAHERVRSGLGIKLQVASIFTELSVRENLWLAAYGRSRNKSAADMRSAEMLDWLGLADRAEDVAAALSHGQKQWLEIGMVIAAEPSVILLDEPTAGMTRDETARMAAMIRLLGQSVSVIVVEHDMEFVRALDVPVTVFHQGHVFASGSLDELRQDERILDIYLGRQGHQHAA
ncbi:branched-chain amino acid ABC transporter [Caballeronia arvi]|uniref:Branched-chain amino acid ABC transporter n=1 Tax=Caballeronia arvi TaxID=1777135 RepID=A0A158KLA8_9BURK|nr:ATP-binding cassette domain-containing protein [Caballeronia arvi]SAL81191.1 branched-chain amino acid ABC transporter [Caballeronia arvi]